MNRSKSWLGQLRFIGGLTEAVDNSSWSGYKSFVSLDMLCNLRQSQTIHDFQSNPLNLILSDSKSTIIPWFKSDEPWFFMIHSQEKRTFRWFSPNSVLNRTHINFRWWIICLISENEPIININSFIAKNIQKLVKIRNEKFYFKFNFRFGIDFGVGICKPV